MIVNKNYLETVSQYEDNILSYSRGNNLNHLMNFHLMMDMTSVPNKKWKIGRFGLKKKIDQLNPQSIQPQQY